MNVLGIETATTEAAVALVRDGELIASARVAPTRRHTEVLFGLIDEVLLAARWKIQDIGGIACDIGPGLFTGLRVGVAAAQGFGVAGGIGVVGVTSLEALASMSGHEGTRAVMVDARRGEVFIQRFTGPAESPLAEGPPIALAPRLLAGFINAGDIVVGDGGSDAARALADLGAHHLPHFSAPSAEAIGRLGMAQATTAGWLRPSELRPLYLRDADATVNFATRPVRP